jgi:hypothetical protein
MLSEMQEEVDVVFASFLIYLMCVILFSAGMYILNWLGPIDCARGKVVYSYFQSSNQKGNK